MTTSPAGALASDCEHRLAGDRWWLSAPALLRAIEHPAPVRETSACYRLGDAVLEIASDDPALLDLFASYRDCATPDPVARDEARVRCAVRRVGHPPLLVLTFRKGAPPDPAGASFSLLRPTRAVPPYTVRDSPLPGWRLAGGPVEPVLAASATHVVIDPRQVPPDFIVEYLVGIALAAQPELLTVHAASLSIGGAGLLLIGNSHAGKTTTSLNLAFRGHALLGDEVAPIRLATNEILPFRRAVNVRAGPHAPRLPSAQRPLGDGDTPPPGERWTGPHRIGELFPGSTPRPTRLRAAFFLDGFADRPSLAAFRPSLSDDLSTWLATPEIAYASWGLTPARRALRLFTLRQVLARLPCRLLKLGPPVETAELIERTMEGL